MAQYELMLILDPSLGDEDRNQSVTGVKKLFEDHSISLLKEDVWGDKKLAYKINKSDRGYYILFDLEMNGETIKTISKTMNLDKNIWRYMFVKKES